MPTYGGQEPDRIYTEDELGVLAEILEKRYNNFLGHVKKSLVQITIIDYEEFRDSYSYARPKILELLESHPIDNVVLSGKGWDRDASLALKAKIELVYNGLTERKQLCAKI